MHIFGYGSLLWHPNFNYVRATPGIVFGYVRRFWLLSPDHRGTPNKPGRVVGLFPHKNGTCWGLAYQIKENDIDSTFQYLDQRERRKLITFVPSDGSSMFEVAVYGAKMHNNICSTDEIVKQIIRSRGSSGTNLEYALRLANCQRKMAPNVWDEHLFEIEEKLLKECENLHHDDAILRQLGYELSYLK